MTGSQSEGGRHALVAGASSDIGRAVAVELASLGYSLSLWGRDPARLETSVRACRAVTPRCAADLVDVTDPVAVEHAVGAVRTRGSLSAVVYAAGVFDWAPADAAQPERTAEVIGVNLTGAALVARLTLPHLIEAAPSSLIFIGSGAAHQVFAGNAAYVASKHGLAGLAGATFLDVRDRDVKVSLISPGLVAAGAGLLSPAGQATPERLLEPEDVASAVRFVVTFPARGCPTQMHLQPQRTPQ